MLNLKLQDVTSHLPLLYEATSKLEHPSYRLNPIEILSRRNKIKLCIHKDCLLILEYWVSGHYVTKLRHHPISLDGNKEREREVLDECLNNGISSISSDISHTPYGTRKEFSEIVVSSDFQKTMTGKKYARARGYLNKYKNEVANGNITQEWSSLSSIKSEIIQLCEKWKGQRNTSKKGNRKFKSKLEEAFKSEQTYPISVLSHRNKKGDLIHSQVNVEIGNKIFSSLKYRDYDFDPTIKFGWISDGIVLEQKPHIKEINLGTISYKDMAFSKTRLPHTNISYSKIKPHHLITKEEWYSLPQQAFSLFQ